MNVKTYAMSAARHLLDAASIEGKNLFERTKIGEGVGKASIEMGKYENPLDGLRETRDVLSTLGNEGNYPPGLIDNARVLVFEAYNKR